ncbi:MAG TPA: hypothetical protein VJQ07_00495 [Gaiellaceae bacterium]|nr:hypothetical protein [Gaiellaceae bacterium]
MNRGLLLWFGVVALAALATSASASPAGRSPICTHGLGTVERDPRHLLPLTSNSIAPATAAALRYTNPSARPEVVSASLATADHLRGGEAKVDCGARVWRRTVVVYITLRAFLPSSASLSEKVFFVGHFRQGYRVWQVVH